MKDNSEEYVDTIKEFYLGRRGSRKGKDRHKEFHTHLTPHELSLIPKGKKVLDAGAGDGLFAKLMEEKGNEVICVELSDELILRCEENGLKCVKANLNSELPFPDNYFDVVFCRAVIEHLFDPWQFFEESYRVLKGGGCIIITTSNTAFVKDRLMLMIGKFPLTHDLKHYTPKNLKSALEDKGFKVIIDRSRKGDPIWQRILVRFWSGFMRSIIAIGEKP